MNSVTAGRPRWADYLEAVGRHTAQLGTCNFGESSPRALLSLPTGRFSYWLLASGAMQANLPQLEPVQAGSRVATWHRDFRKMDDAVLKESDGKWKLGGVQIDPTTWPMVSVPPSTPEDRSGRPPAKDYKKALSSLPGRQHDWYVWYATYCLRPVVIVGTGREHIQRQRQTLLEHAPGWFPDHVAALLDEDSGMTSAPERMLFHPFMVFDAGVGEDRPWLRQMRPRLVIVTSWSSYLRMDRSLFSRSPHVIIANRRVRSASDARAELPSLARHGELDAPLNANRPGGVFAHGYSTVAQGDAGGPGDDGSDFDEELI